MKHTGLCQERAQGFRFMVLREVVLVQDWQRREAWEGGQWSDRMPMYVAHLTETAEGVLELVACPVDSAASPRSQSPAQRDSSSS